METADKLTIKCDATGEEVHVCPCMWSEQVHVLEYACLSAFACGVSMPGGGQPGGRGGGWAGACLSLKSGWPPPVTMHICVWSEHAWRGGSQEAGEVGWAVVPATHLSPRMPAVAGCPWKRPCTPPPRPQSHEDWAPSGLALSWQTRLDTRLDSPSRSAGHQLTLQPQPGRALAPAALQVTPQDGVGMGPAAAAAVAAAAAAAAAAA